MLGEKQLLKILLCIRLEIEFYWKEIVKIFAFQAESKSPFYNHS